MVQENNGLFFVAKNVLAGRVQEKGGQLPMYFFHSAGEYVNCCFSAWTGCWHNPFATLGESKAKCLLPPPRAAQWNYDGTYEDWRPSNERVEALQEGSLAEVQNKIREPED